MVRRAFSGISNLLKIYARCRPVLARVPEGPPGMGPSARRKQRGEGSGGDRRSLSFPSLGECDQAGIGCGFVTLAGRGATSSSNTSVQNTAMVAIVRPIAA